MHRSTINMYNNDIATIKLLQKARAEAKMVIIANSGTDLLLKASKTGQLS